MNPEDDDREPIEVLYDIEEKVSGSADSPEPSTALKPRMSVGGGTKREAVLQYIIDNEGATLNEMRGVVADRVTGTLTDLWNVYYLDRSGSKGNYKYSITNLGLKALSEKQQKLADARTDGDARVKQNPWVNEDVSEAEYHALRALRDTDGHPSTQEINSLFREYSGAKKHASSSYAVSPRMSNLYKSGFVDRTPDQPYIYWLTDKGKDALDD